MDRIFVTIVLLASVSLTAAAAKEESENVKDVNYAGKLSHKARQESDAGNYRDAIELFKDSLSLFKKHLKGNNPDVANVYNELALTYDHLGEYKKALDMKMKSYEMIKGLYGDGDHDNVAIAINNIGLTYYKMGDYDKVLKYYTKSLAMLRRLHGKVDNEQIATLLNNLGSSYDSLGKYEKANDHYEEALNMYRRLNEDGKEDANIAVGLNNIAGTYYKQGRYNEALTTYTEALEIYKKINMGDSPQIATCLNNIAVQNEILGKVNGLRTALDPVNQNFSPSNKVLKKPVRKLKIFKIFH
jgi:tetratricopeptide (TPR) repeat protein